ncbi:vitamin K epoxide reductase family protein [Gulosibacter molinativorax]|uniref:Vitamin K epoxide reductase domain-containing protein n=1 Tax=Gulosibacter molinativorax TaxID=256821 RepID=A0ABT7CCQ7_9MICO|nr:vitamin K epoxide reductase family protein [Gulosibacter molinativorax]MDJ1372539.1 hypothetical protein [Gulosibacter molinativorax]QUY62602.1 Hypotetical protein [Gulosibacter molinativorax]
MSDPDEVRDADAESAASETTATQPSIPAIFRGRGLGWALIVLGGIGLIASFALTLEYIHALTEPDAQLLCDISIFVTCQPAMMSSAGAVLGFPNIILGLICFTIAVTTGVVLATGAKLPNWYMVCFNIGLLGGAVLITYLQWFSGFQLRALCLWCMIIWTATIPLMSITTIGNLATGRFGKGATKVGQALTGWAWVIIVIWYLAVIGLVLAGMWETIRLSMI